MLLGFLAAAAQPAPARADGAFPDAQNLLTPAGWPDDFLLATTFGVVFSRDGGRTWLWTCEQDGNLLGQLYQMGPGPRHRVVALANKKVVFSDDMTCSWRIAGGALTGAEIKDVWVDRVVPDRVFAVGVRPGAADAGVDAAVYAVYPSTDGAQFFGPPAYIGAPGEVVTGVETAASDPRVVYLTVEAPGRVPVLLRSNDRGATWERRELATALGPGNLRLVDVDPQDPERVFLIWREILRGEQLVLTEDGGRTATVRFAGIGDGRALTAFVRTPSGALLVATDTNSVGGLYRSTDRGQTFVAVANPPGLRGFSVRGGVLYAGTNNFADGYAIGASVNDGDTWTAVMRYDQVQAVPACARAACRPTCETLVPMLWAAEVCDAEVPAPPLTDGGASADVAPDPSGGGTGAGGGGDAGGAGGGGGTAPHASDGGGMAGGRVVRAGGGGCTCTAGPLTRAEWWWGVVVAAVGARLARRRPRPGLMVRRGTK